MTTPERYGADFIGKGIAFPMRVDGKGSIALTRGADDLSASIVVILSTALGERPMRPDFGCAIWDHLFDPINYMTLSLMSRAVQSALSQWEPRIDVGEVEAEIDPDNPGRVLFQIDYTVRATNDRRNLVYPFYVIPFEEET